MSTNDIQDSELKAVKDGLVKLGESIETIAKRELPKPDFQNNEISGDKIHGGTITEFSTLGIQDKATSLQLVVENDLVTTSNLKVDLIKDTLKVEEDLEVAGTIKASKLEVNEIKADVRNDRTSPLNFDCENDTLYGKGLMWTGTGATYDVLKPRHKQGNETLKTGLQVGATFPKTTMNFAKKVVGVGTAGVKALWSLRKIKG